MALTPAQVRTHIGEMVSHNIMNNPDTSDIRILVRWGIEYIKNGTYGTIEDRKEAMKTVVLLVYNRTIDPIFSSDNHYYREHWLKSILFSDSSLVGE